MTPQGAGLCWPWTLKPSPFLKGDLYLTFQVGKKLASRTLIQGSLLNFHILVLLQVQQ